MYLLFLSQQFLFKVSMTQLIHIDFFFFFETRTNSYSFFIFFLKYQIPVFFVQHTAVVYHNLLQNALFSLLWLRVKPVYKKRES